MSQFGQALDAHGIPYTENQAQADQALREALAEPIDAPFAGFSLKSLLSQGIATYGFGGVCLGLKDGKVTSVSIDGENIELASSIDALIAEIESLSKWWNELNIGYGYSVDDVSIILDKYRGKPCG